MGCGASAAKTAPADEAPPSAAVAAHAAAATAKNVAAVLRKGSSGVIGGGGDDADGAPPSDAAAAAAKEKRRKKKEKKAAKAAAAAAAAAAAEAAAAPKATGVSALSVMQRLRSSRAVTAAEGAGGAKAGDRRPGQHEEGAAYRFFAIKDQYSSLDEVSAALRAAGLESSNLIVAIDFTKSNTWTGRDTYGGRSLHDTSFDNPYQLAIRTIGTVMAPYDDDNLIPVFGFGDSTTTDKSVFPFFPDRPARGFPEVLERYKEIVPRVHMSGPTNFAPAIEAAIQICEVRRGARTRAPRLARRVGRQAGAARVPRPRLLAHHAMCGASDPPAHAFRLPSLPSPQPRCYPFLRRLRSAPRPTTSSSSLRTAR